MKKLVYLTGVIVVATLGLLKVHADFSNGQDGGGYGDSWDSFSTVPSGLSSVHIELVALAQGNTSTNTNNGVINVHLRQKEIDNNDILGLINDEFGTSFSRTNGNQLAVSNFWDGKFVVLDKSGNVVLANASANTNGDHYLLELTSTQTVYAATIATNSETKYSVTDGILKYESGNGSNSFNVQGFTTVNDYYFHDFSNSVESFQLSGGIGSGSLNFGTNGVFNAIVTGSAYGSGKNNAPAP